jgi:hypothetical protein
MKYWHNHSIQRSTEFRNSDGKPLGDLVNQLMRAYGLEDKMKELDVIQAWPELMGPAVANRTTSLRVHHRVLHVAMDSAVMREELAGGKQIIIDRINSFAGKQMIHDVWFT